MARKYSKLNNLPTPGPSDYRYDPVGVLKRETRVTIGRAKKENVLESR